ARRRRRQQRFGMLAIMLVLLAGTVYAVGYDPGGVMGEGGLGFGSKGNPTDTLPQGPAPGSSPEAAAYWTVASELRGISPKNVEGVNHSTLDPSWASVRITQPEDDSTWVLFVHRENDSWKALKSIRADEPDHPENEKAVLDDVPKDLVESIYPPDPDSGVSGLLSESVEPSAVPSVEPPAISPSDPVTDNVPESERERIEKGLEGVRKAVDDHEGISGVYVLDLNGGWGYGVRPDEPFFSASVAKVPVMVAVFRRIDEGKLSLEDSFETKSEDWAAGAGWMQWDPAGKSHTVKDYLSMMMGQSDNVAANALTRVVGGREYVNEVARSLGAPNTLLYQKVTSARAPVTSLDNRTTPRDMATILQQIGTDKAASTDSCREMIDIMLQNHLESGLKEALPKDTEVAAKGGWLYRIYDEVAIVGHEDHPYAVAIFNRQGPEDPKEGKPLLKDISKAVWKTQDG
ncbi:MAG: metallo-hydrolase family protein, partial [Rubrobacter sp.]|nr:metallo-hydrolase family protein [Rubrobacter sp.]